MYHTKLLFNDYKRGVKVLRTIQHELISCEEFLFSVAFITEGGLNILANELKEAYEKGVKGKILTSSYLYFNNPKMFKKILKYPGIEVRVYEQHPLHTKGYIFKKPMETSFIVGSSNLTESALCSNSEWNIQLTSLNQGQIIEDSMNEFFHIWDKAVPLTKTWIAKYQTKFDEIERVKTESIQVDHKEILIPNSMQVDALRNLDKLRKEGKDKALLRSSTGTGKTYLSAFDVKNFNPKRALFVIHREQIARDAMNSFKRVMPDRTYGMLSGNQREVEADFIFTTVQMMSKERVYSQFSKEHFDYIIIDEAHRSGASSYHNILNHFTPKFLLGMTATPERTDNLNIYENFDYNIAYEIRLQEAMEEDMLCPFHYFGVTELTINEEEINEKTDFNKLTSDSRINHVIENIEYYGYSGDRVKGLIFCSRNEEAAEISKLMNERGYMTVALSGSNTQEEREYAIERLVSKERNLDYIVTVDIFNEGIDIPELNQIVMLRPTQSAIIFVQQLGRGLRKNKEKKYVNIIDFIGNYQNNFLIPVALSGDTSFDKDNIRKFMIEGNSTLPGNSTINFDKISRNKIFDAINQTKFSTTRFLIDEYFNLKNRIGKIPKLVDFNEQNSIDPLLILKSNARMSYHKFLLKTDDTYDFHLSEDEDLFLTIVSQELSSGKRDIELLMIKELIEKGSVSKKDLEEYIVKDGDYESALRLIDLSFYTQATSKKFEDKSFVITETGITTWAPWFKFGESFNYHLNDLITFSLEIYSNIYTERSST